MSKTNHPTKLWWLIATWFGSGLSPVASGTAGSLAALPFAYFIQLYLGRPGLLIATVAIFFIGWWASNKYLKHNSSPYRGEVGRGAQSAQSEQVSPHPNPPPNGEGIDSDPKEIVVDEVAGMWLTLACISQLYPLWVSYLTAFFLFRLFDIIKIWPASWADQKVKGGLGVMLDDFFAAFQAILVIWIFYLASHGN